MGKHLWDLKSGVAAHFELRQHKRHVAMYAEAPCSVMGVLKARGPRHMMYAAVFPSLVMFSSSGGRYLQSACEGAMFPTLDSVLSELGDMKGLAVMCVQNIVAGSACV